jgi:hypothetical protein
MRSAGRTSTSTIRRVGEEGRAHVTVTEEVFDEGGNDLAVASAVTVKDGVAA